MGVSIVFVMSIGMVDMTRRRAIDPIGPPALPARPPLPLPGSHTKILALPKIAPYGIWGMSTQTRLARTLERWFGVTPILRASCFFPPRASLGAAWRM